jgi:hypothetical protein
MRKGRTVALRSDLRPLKNKSGVVGHLGSGIHHQIVTAGASAPVNTWQPSEGGANLGCWRNYGRQVDYLNGDYFGRIG